MLPVISAQGGRWTTIEKDIKRSTNTETTLDKKKKKKEKTESPPVSENIHPTRCRMERRREKLRRRRKSINNETFIKASSGASSARQGQPANAGGFAVFGILRWHWQEVVSSYASGLTKTLKNNPFFSKFWTILCACPLVSWRKAHFYSLWLSLCLLSNSFHSCSECFPCWSLLFINVLGIACIFKLLHKINKRAGNGGGKKNPDLFVMLERPLRTLSIFPSIVGV